MGYSDEKQRIIDYVTNDGMIIELTPNKETIEAWKKQKE